MKKLFIFILVPFFLFAYKVDIYKWGKKDTFYGFLKRNSLPLNIYYNLPLKIKRYVRAIPRGESVFILKDNNIIKQALIPINSKQQLQIIKTKKGYKTKIVPIIYETLTKHATTEIKHYLSYDIYKATRIRTLASKLAYIFSDRINFRALPKNTKVDIVYEEKIKFGEVKEIKVLYAKFSNKYYRVDAFLNPYDGRYYDSNGKSLKGMFLAAPLRYKRISSPFGRRFHPILHKWRMHDGIDYVNKIGTPIHAVADGKIIYKGWIKGYGRSIKIKHKNGYITLYAHLHGYPRGIYVGRWVTQGQIIGYLGNSGLSTGPHLHFGVMHYGKWINPVKLRNSVKVTLYGKKKKQFLAYIQNFAKENNIALK